MEPTSQNYKSIAQCRVCKSYPLQQVHSFGVLPLADRLIYEQNEKIPSYPLTLVHCSKCLHLQIQEDVDPEVLFRNDYPYYSGSIPELVTHFRNYYTEVVEKVSLKQPATVIEIACNDGLLLDSFLKAGYNVLGVEPSLGPAELAQNKGIKVIREFFNKTVAKHIATSGYKADLILANNVLAHVPDPLSLAEGIEKLLADNGTAVVEVPFSLNMLKNGTYDVIFHQHYSYFSMHSLKFLFESVGLFINDVRQVATQGGSLRLFLNKYKNKGDLLDDLLVRENYLHDASSYIKFSASINRNKEQIVGLLNDLKAKGKKIIAYGAPGKAATYLNYNNIGLDVIDFMVDISPTKQNKKFPNAGFPIYDPKILAEAAPDYVLILSWNYAPSIMQQLSYLRAHCGTAFIIPFPTPHII